MGGDAAASDTEITATPLLRAANPAQPFALKLSQLLGAAAHTRLGLTSRAWRRVTTETDALHWRPLCRRDWRRKLRTGKAMPPRYGWQRKFEELTHGIARGSGRVPETGQVRDLAMNGRIRMGVSSPRKRVTAAHTDGPGLGPARARLRPLRPPLVPAARRARPRDRDGGRPV